MIKYYKTNYTGIEEKYNVIYKVTPERLVFKYEPNGWYQTRFISPDYVESMQEITEAEVLLELL